MIEKYLEYICCPDCKKDLFITNETLSCASCGEKYEIVEGFPVLIDLNSIPEHLARQIKYFQENPEYNLNYKLAKWQESYLERFKSNIKKIENTLIVDCGAGSGYMTIELAKMGATVIACDVTFKSLVHLKKVAASLNLLDKIFFICCSAQELPIKTQIIDSFISNAVLEHLPEEKKAIIEINRVCKKTSSLMVTVPLSYYLLNPILLPVNIIHDWKIGHLRRYSSEVLQKKFTQWRLINHYYTGHFIKVMMVLINSLLKVFNDGKIELIDKKKEHIRWGASNIITFFTNERLSDAAKLDVEVDSD